MLNEPQLSDVVERVPGGKTLFQSLRSFHAPSTSCHKTVSLKETHVSEKAAQMKVRSHPIFQEVGCIRFSKEGILTGWRVLAGMILSSKGHLAMSNKSFGYYRMGCFGRLVYRSWEYWVLIGNTQSQGSPFSLRHTHLKTLLHTHTFTLNTQII